MSLEARLWPLAQEPASLMEEMVLTSVAKVLGIPANKIKFADELKDRQKAAGAISGVLYDMNRDILLLVIARKNGNASKMLRSVANWINEDLIPGEDGLGPWNRAWAFDAIRDLRHHADELDKNSHSSGKIREVLGVFILLGAAADVVWRISRGDFVGGGQYLSTASILGIGVPPIATLRSWLARIARHGRSDAQASAFCAASA